jgi:hypothetical protein
MIESKASVAEAALKNGISMSSFQRKLESSALMPKQSRWTPAFAGVTVLRFLSGLGGAMELKAG